jgi:hypothetical protein
VQPAVNRLVAGSNPARGASLFNRLALLTSPKSAVRVRYGYGAAPYVFLFPAKRAPPAQVQNVWRDAPHLGVCLKASGQPSPTRVRIYDWEAVMRFFSLFVSLLLFSSAAHSAVTCTAPDHSDCTITCPEKATGCAALWSDGKCTTECYYQTRASFSAEIKKAPPSKIRAILRKARPN